MMKIQIKYTCGVFLNTLYILVLQGLHRAKTIVFDISTYIFISIPFCLGNGVIRKNLRDSSSGPKRIDSQ
jgi:hypothetical protein